MKKVLALALALVLVLSLVACGNTSVEETEAPTIDDGITIPDIKDTDETTAKNLLSSSGFIPVIEYQYNDNVEDGKVINTSPSIGSNAEKNSKVTVYVSKGASFLQSSNYTAKASGIDDNIQLFGEYGGFSEPYIDSGYLFLPITMLKNNNVRIIEVGKASINDTFDKTVPCDIVEEPIEIYEHEDEYVNKIVKISLSDLDIKKPTSIYTQIEYETNGNYYAFYTEHHISW